MDLFLKVIFYLLFIRHSVREIRKWEKESGKCWADLSSEEREDANKYLTNVKKLKSK